MNAAESIAIALDAVRAQKLRSGLTLLSISIGVFAIIASTGITTALQNAVNMQMATLGEHSFLIQRTPTLTFGGSWRKYMRRKPITLEQARQFRDRMTLTNLISISNTNPSYVIKAGQTSTDPDVALIGADDLYFNVNAVNLSEGRPFSLHEGEQGGNVAILGNDVVVKLFPRGGAVGSTVTIRNQTFRVIGILEVRGGVMGQSQDNRVLIPMPIFDRYFTWEWDRSVDVSVKAASAEALPATVDEATGILRALRGVKPWEENTFELDTNDALTAQFSGFSVALLAVAWISGIGALVAAGIGIMNMMLVSVRERTREIGVRKALGARRAWIVRQFLIESVTLCQLGGMAGTAAGIGTSWAVTTLLRNTGMQTLVFDMPWGAVIFSVVICTAIGIGFGLYPAFRAASLDPIEALRYE
ncbi:MAG: ABC transporter permease [Candidatus Kapabacteria bacterium]|nr:ABC transporter permease [Candidatus Kapabacteria bacterium]